MDQFQDGQTQTINGTTYVRQGGVWHAQGEASPFGTRPVIQEAPPTPNAPSGYRFATGGNLEAIPGGPADPNKDAPKVGASQVTGQDYLKTLDSGTASLVKALADGRKSFPSGSALRSPYWQEMLTHVSNYDPGFDEVNYTGRSATRRDFTSGKAANNIRALNTAIGHLGHLEEQIGGTASHGFTPLNAVENTGLRLFGDPGPTNFDATVSALAGELTAVYRGSGGAEADIQRYIEQLNPNASQAQKEGTIRNIVGLLKSRLDALNDQYRQGMGTTAQQLQLLDPQAQLIVQHLGGFDAAGAPQGPSDGPPPPPMPGDQMAPATGDTKETVDANLTPVRREYMARLQAGQSGAELVKFLREAGVSDPKLLRTAGEQAAFRRKNPNIPVGQYDTSAIDHITEQMSPVNKAVNYLGQGDIGAGAVAAGNAMLGGFGPDVVGALGGNEAQARAAQEYSAQDHPGAALTGNIVGGTLAALGGEAALARGAGMAPGFARSLAADSGYGAVAGAGNNPDNRAEGAMLGGVAGAAGSIAGQGIAKGAAAALRGVTSPAVKALGDTPLTVGQAVSQSGRAGAMVKSAEDRLAGFGGVGDMINARRAEGVKSFNAKAFDKALEPISGTVGDQVGQEAVDKAHSIVSDAFKTALQGKQAVPDQEFIKAARGPLERLANNKRFGPEIIDAIEQSTAGIFDEGTGAISGEHMQAFMDALRQIKRGYKTDPLYQTTIKPSLQGLENAVEGMFARQAPEVMPAFNRAKQAYRRVSILADAVNKGNNTGKVFTPAQLRSSDLANAKKYDGAINAAKNGTQFDSLSGPAQEILPSKVPDSGTAGRLALVAPGTLVGGGAALGYVGGDTKTGAEAGLGLTGILALAYTKTGQRRLVSMLTSRNPRARAMAEEVMKRLPMAGAAGSALTQSGGGQ